MNSTFLKSKREAFNYLKSLIVTRIKNEQAHPDNPLYKKFPTTWSFPHASGWSLIHLAIVLGDLDTVKDLIENKQVSVSGKMPFGDSTPIEIALVYNKPEIAKYLLQQGANITDCLRFWMNPGDTLVLFDKLIKERIDAARIKDWSSLAEPTPGSHKSLLDFAAEIGDIDTLKEFDRHKKLATIYNQNEEDTNLLLHQAVGNNQFETVKFLLQQNFPLDLVDSSGSTPLHMAAGFADRDIVKLLLNNGAKINSRDRNGWTPLYAAIFRGRLASIQVLKDYNADPHIKSYLGNTIFHAATNNDIDIATLFPETDLADLKQQKNIYNESAEDFRKHQSDASLAQNTLRDKFSYYCELNYRNKSYLSNDGYCNGLIFLFQYYDSKNKLDVFFSIIKTISQWSGTMQGLQLKPKPPLDEVYKTVGEVFEEFLTFSIYFQMSTIDEFPINQKDRRTQMALLNQSINLTMACHDQKLTRDRLAEIIRILQKCPPNTRVEVGGFKHATTFKKDVNNSIVYYDCNFTKRFPPATDCLALCDTIINTKYHYLDNKNECQSVNGSPIVYDLRFTTYHFPWDKYPIDFNYFSDEELPKNEDEVRIFQQNSPNHFSPLHIAIMTNSKKNLQQLLASKVCKIDETALQLAYDCADEEMVECLLQQDIQWQDPQIFIKLEDKELEPILDAIINKDTSKNLEHFLDRGVYTDNLELIKELFVHHKINLQATLPRIARYLNFSDVPDQTKMLLYEKYKNIVDRNGLGLIHQAILQGKSNSLAFLIKHGPSQFIRTNGNETLFEWLSKHGYKKNDPMDLENIRKLLPIMLDDLPSSISVQDGWYLLMTLHDCGEPLLSQYAEKICSSIYNINKFLGNSIFKYTILQAYSQRLDDVITLALLKHMDYNAVNFQSHQTKNTALHTVLNKVPKNDQEREKIFKIVEALKAKTDLSLVNRDGFSCQDLIDEHCDIKLRQRLQAMKIQYHRRETQSWYLGHIRNGTSS